MNFVRSLYYTYAYKTKIYNFLHICIGIMVRVFTNGPKNKSSIPGWVLPKTQKMTLDFSILNTQYYKVRIKCQWKNPGKWVASSPTPRCSSYGIVSIRDSLNQLTYIYLYTIPDVGIMVRVFANCPGDLDSILGRIVPKTQKWYLVPP